METVHDSRKRNNQDIESNVVEQLSEQQLLMLLNEWKHKHNIKPEALKDFEAILDKLRGEDDESR